MFKKKREAETLKKIRDEIDLWRHDNPTFMVVDVLNSIRQDKNLMEQYFPEIDWSKVDKDSIYKKLFEGSTTLEQQTKQTRRK